MEEDKKSYEKDDDSHASSSDFDSDEQIEEEDQKEMDTWSAGSGVYDSHFSDCCQNLFSPSTEIELYSKTDVDTPLKCFSLIFSPTIMDKIVSESIKYAQQQIANGTMKKSVEDNSAYCIFNKKGLKIQDILLYFGAILFMGFNKKSEQELHWSSEPCDDSNFLKEYITCAKYKIIKQIFHLADNLLNIGKHKFYKIADFMENLTFQFRRFYAPSQFLSIDESMISFKGRSKFKFYIPSKPTKWGMKLHSLCDSKTGYCLDFSLDPGKTIKKSKDFLYSLIMKMLNPFLNKYHLLFTDSFYTTIQLFENLYEKLTGYTAMINKRRKGLPKDFIEKENEKKINCTSNGIIMLTKFIDKKTMLCASTVYNSDPVEIEKKNKKDNSK